MSVRKIIFEEHEYYHVYNRGNSKQSIFHDAQDYQRFVELLYICNTSKHFNLYDIRKYQKNLDIFLHDRSDSLVAIGAYCLMSNHFHILITQIVDGGISAYMQKIATAYSMYYNKKYTRTGSLFEGKFKAIHLDTDRYLKYIFSYIHLNPVKLIDPRWKERGIVDTKKVHQFLDQYQYSSYIDFNRPSRLSGQILDTSRFPEYFPTKEHFHKEITEWIKFQSLGKA
jgi:REP element-mobilizing transposase RayT